ncbi:MAG: hypothetical protein OXG07_04585 [Anaerolineaceae bacterium]|nr:hypothetical protein [Anaerolineaceae bacterium]
MNKRERLLRTFAGEPTDRTPVAFWRHWPGDDERAADFARVLIDFQNTFDPDFLRILPAQTWAVADYGLQDTWRGALDGTRHITRHVVERSLDWTNLRTLTPLRGVVGRQLEALRLVLEGLDDDTPVLMSLPSPFTQAGQLTGFPRLFRHMRQRPERLRVGLELLTSGTQRIVDEMQRYPLAGICYEMSLASHEFLSVGEYQTVAWPFDRAILDSLPRAWWFNMISFPVNAPMFRLAADTNLPAINWDDQSGEPDLLTGRSRLYGAACAGLSAQEQLHDGTPATVLNRARAAQQLCGNRRFILAPGSPLLVTTPLSNLRAMRLSVESGGPGA